MKLLTLNAHSLQEPDGKQKLNCFADALQTLYPDVIALQEVNQTMTAPLAGPLQLSGYVPAPGHNIPVLEDNWAMRVALRLLGDGISFSWTWLPIKRGYGKYDEGLALFSLSDPIVSTDIIQLSRQDQYEDWHTRKALGIQLEGRPDWFYSVHMGWWGETGDAFSEQWVRLETALADRRRNSPIWLMGDFNAPAHVRGESRDLIISSRWQDTYELAGQKDSGVTVKGAIDGWKDKLSEGISEGMRLDYIWCSHTPRVIRSQVAFNGLNYPVISDHYGVFVETEETL